MALCNKCWSDAFTRSLSDTTKTQTQHYNDLLKERENNPTPECVVLDYSKGCIHGNELSCDCDVNIGECKARELKLENWQNSYWNKVDEVEKLKIHIEKQFKEIRKLDLKIKELESDKFCGCQKEIKTGCTSAMHCNICGKLEQTETWLRENIEPDTVAISETERGCLHCGITIHKKGDEQHEG